jgi:hypothetical protein
MLTAVDWLIDESMKLVIQYMKGTLNENTLDDVIYEISTKAKEMEKQQILEARLDIYTTGDLSAEEYYNKKFKPC